MHFTVQAFFMPGHKRTYSVLVHPRVERQCAHSILVVCDSQRDRHGYFVFKNKIVMTDNENKFGATTRSIETSAHETGKCEPQSLLELDMLYQQAQQRLRAEGAEAFGRMKRQRAEANDTRRREVVRLRRELAELERQIEEAKADCEQAVEQAKDEYHAVAESIALRRATLKDWFTLHRVRLSGR